MSALGVNEHHATTVLNYMRFARYQRGQRLRAVDGSFQDLKDSRFVEDTFTVDEVEEMLDGLLAVVRAEVESELINTAHTNVLLLRQVFQQAEQWHLKLQADISELENRDLLEQINEFEEQEFAGAKRDAAFKISTSKLQPLNESSGSSLLNMDKPGSGGKLSPLSEDKSTALLHMEISRLKEENDRLMDKLKNAESQVLSSSRERTSLKDEMDRMRSDVREPTKSGTDPEEIAGLERQLADLKAKLGQNDSASHDQSARLETDLTSTKHELLKIKDMLDMAEKELEKKVNQTAPFRNLKSMMNKKNEQIKDLRKRLGKYEDLDD